MLLSIIISFNGIAALLPKLAVKRLTIDTFQYQSLFYLHDKLFVIFSASRIKLQYRSIKTTINHLSQTICTLTMTLLTATEYLYHK
jgi:hypothetical protein